MLLKKIDVVVSGFQRADLFSRRCFLEIGILLSDFAQQLPGKNADIRNSFSFTPIWVLSQIAKVGCLWKYAKVLHTWQNCLRISAQFSGN